MILFKKKKKKLWRSRPKPRRSKFTFLKRKNGAVNVFKKIIAAELVFFVVYFLFFSDFFLIKNIEINGNKSINSDDVKSAAINEMSAPEFGFIPGNNFLFNKNEKIKSALIKEFSEIKSVEVKKSFPNILEIEIIEKEPTVIWCRFNDCYYVDNSGIVFARANDNSNINNGEKIIKIIEEEIIKEEEITEELVKKEEIKKEKEIKKEEEIKIKEEEIKSSPPDKGGLGGVNPIKINDKISDSDFIDFALDIDKEIRYNTQLKIKFYKTKGTYTRELIAYTDRNIRLYFNTMEDANLQVEHLKDFLLKGVNKNEIDNLEYIYFKAGRKIFYK